MARNRKRVKKSDQYYIDAFNSLHEKHLITFKHNLKFSKKGDKKKGIEPGELINKSIDISVKRKISRYFNAINDNPNADIILIPRKKNESIKKYKKRVRRIKNKNKQFNNPLPAIIENHSSETQYKFNNRTEEIEIAPYWNANGEVRTEFIFLDDRLTDSILISDDDDFKLFRKIAKKAIKQNQNKKAIESRIFIKFEKAISRNSVRFDNTDIDKVIDLLIKDLIKAFMITSGQVYVDFVTGFFITHNEI